VFKLLAEDTGGALSVVEHPFAVGALVPPHLHTREDEYSIVLEGEIGSARATVKPSLALAATSPSHGVSCMPCGTRASHRRA